MFKLICLANNKCKKNRPKDIVLNECLGHNDNDVVDFYFHKNHHGISGINQTKYGKNLETEVFKMKTKSLRTIFRENQVPEIIEYFSLDIEGGELNALRGFDFNKYIVLVWQIECNYMSSQEDIEGIKKHMKKNGYVNEVRLSGDEIFIHPLAYDKFNIKKGSFPSFK